MTQSFSASTAKAGPCDPQCHLRSQTCSGLAYAQNQTKPYVAALLPLCDCSAPTTQTPTQTRGVVLLHRAPPEGPYYRSRRMNTHHPSALTTSPRSSVSADTILDPTARASADAAAFKWK